jgi:hypothetical protein
VSEFVAGSVFGARWAGGRDPRELAEGRSEAATLVPTDSTCQGCEVHPSDGLFRCGTRSGFQAHRRREEPPCGCCREAERDYQYMRHLRRKGAA